MKNNKASFVGFLTDSVLTLIFLLNTLKTENSFSQNCPVQCYTEKAIMV